MNVVINGFETSLSECHDAHGNYLLIEIPDNAPKSFSNIGGQMIGTHLIKEIGYHRTDGKITHLKAYY